MSMTMAADDLSKSQCKAKLVALVAAYEKMVKMSS